MPRLTKADSFVSWFRDAAPYIHAFRGKTFVIAFGGEVVDDGMFAELTHDLNLLGSLGIRLVLVHGARPQIGRLLQQRNIAPYYVQGRRVTDLQSLECVKQAIGQVRVEIEALLSLGLANSPMAGAGIRVASGNFVTAQPIGVLDGVDLQHTGAVRKIDVDAIRAGLEHGAMILLSPLGYSPTGESFNLTLEDVASRAAVALRAEKLIFLMDEAGLNDAAGLVRELTVRQAEERLQDHASLPEDLQLYLPAAMQACRQGVAKAHLISRHTSGGIVQELFTRDGVGTMLTRDPVETLRQATIEDVGGLLRLIEPLEMQGVLVKRSRERLEQEITRFHLLEHDRLTIGCVALYAYPDEHMGELACLVVHPDFGGSGRGDALLRHVERLAEQQGLQRIFVLTTRTAHWFQERGFVPAEPDDLPLARQRLYNWQRRSKVFVKPLTE